MTLYFSKTEFNKSASNIRKSALKDHLDILDGMEVEPGDRGYYQTPEYEFNGRKYQIYPVMEDWCTEERQERLF